MAVAWVGRRLYATEYTADAVAEIGEAGGTVLRRLRVGAYPRSLAGVPGGGALLVANTGSRDVSVLDLAKGKERGRLRCSGEPGCVAASPDGKTAVVPNLIPTGDATREDNAITVGIFDIGSLRRLADIKLPSGSVNARGAAVTPDGRWACITHALGRFNLPTTQLDRGWVNTNALSVLDLQARKHYATVLLDQPQEGASDPWGIAVSKDGKRVWITLAGVHEIAGLDFARMMKWTAGGLPDDSPVAKSSPEWAITMRNIWQEIKANPAHRTELVNDLAALYVGDLIERVGLPGAGPRGLALAPDGKTLAAAQYFTGDVALTDTTGKVRMTISLGPSAKPNASRRGERIFHDGTMAFQHWLSCSTCHPDGRADGLNWDLLNDGIGNPKNTRSLLLAHRRGPMMSHGIRSSLTVATSAGFRFILFRMPEAGEVADTEAYIRSMQPLPSPHRTGAARGALSAKAVVGKALFMSPRTRCTRCHTGSAYTDKKLHDTGTRGPFDSGSRFVTPTLVELWRTAPYLHDGRAVTMQEVLTRYNRANKHGATSHLSRAQVDALAEYLLSL
jgi:DNA-binding beta-propeller fold protein YncE